jgi:phospholipid transport system transporter-binding protein
MSNSRPQQSDRHCKLDAGGDGTARLNGALTFATVSALFRQIERGLPDGESIERIDLAGVTAVDSAGLALLLEWQARMRGRELVMQNAPHALLRLAHLCEADDLLRLSGREATR